MTATQDSPLRKAAGVRGRPPVAFPLIACLLLLRAPAAPCAEPAAPPAPPATERAAADLLAVLRQGDGAPAAEALTLLTARRDRLSADERRQAGTQALSLVRRLTGMTLRAHASIPAALALIDAMPPPGAAEVLTAFVQARTSRLEALSREHPHPFSLDAEKADEQNRLSSEIAAAIKALQSTDAPLDGPLLVRAVFATGSHEAELALAGSRSPNTVAALIRELRPGHPAQTGWLALFTADQGPRRAVRLLSILRPPQGVAPLLALLADRKRAVQLRADAAWALSLYALTSDADRRRIQAALWRFVDTSRPDPRHGNLRPGHHASACDPPASGGGGVAEGPNPTYWTLPFAAPALSLCADPGSLARIEAGLHVEALDEFDHLSLLQTLAFSVRGAAQGALVRDIEQTRKRHTLPPGARACELQDHAPYLDRLRKTEALAELGRRCDTDWRCYAQALDPDAAQGAQGAQLVRKAALSIAQTVPPAERDAAIDALFMALERRPAPERPDLLQLDRQRSWPLLALGKLAPTGACPRCVERLSALVRKGLAGGATGAYADLEAASLLNRWTARGR